MSDSGQDLAGTGIWAGVVAPLLYVLVVVVGGFAVAGYDPMAEPISSLTAAGRTGVHWIEAGFALYNVLVLVFAVSSLVLHGRRWRWVSIGLVGVAATGLLMWPFAMDLPGAGLSPGGAIHIGLAGLAAVLTIGVTALSSVDWFRAGRRGMGLFSAACVLAVLVFGPLAGIATIEGWPLAGLFERITIGTFELWLLVSALALIREASAKTATR